MAKRSNTQASFFDPIHIVEYTVHHQRHKHGLITSHKQEVRARSQADAIHIIHEEHKGHYMMIETKSIKTLDSETDV